VAASIPGSPAAIKDEIGFYALNSSHVEYMSLLGISFGIIILSYILLEVRKPTG